MFNRIVFFQFSDMSELVRLCGKIYFTKYTFCTVLNIEERFVNHPWYFITIQQTPSNKDKRCLSLPVVVVNSKNQSLVERVPG